MPYSSRGLPATDHLTLGWSDCLEGGGLATAAFACNTNSVDFLLVPAFTLAQAIDSLVAIEGVIDMVSQGDPLPSWWELQPGGCRDGSLVADMPPADACLDPWGGNGVAALQAYRVSPETPATNRARIVFTSSVLPAQRVALGAGTSYAAVRLILHSSRTIGTSCSGCSSTACMVLNSITLKRVPGAAGPDQVVSEPSASTNWVHWLGVTGVDCAVVPVRNTTWGAIKSLYR